MTVSRTPSKRRSRRWSIHADQLSTASTARYLDQNKLPQTPGVECVIIRPPYQAAVPLVGRLRELPPPLGSTIHAEGHHVLPVLGLLTAITHRWPWVAPSIALPTSESPFEPWLSHISDIDARLAVSSIRVHQHLNMRVILSTVRNRPPPSPLAMADYVVSRIKAPELSEALYYQFREAVERVPAAREASLSTYSRHFADYGRYSAQQWRMIAILIHQLVRQHSEPHVQLIHIRTANRYVRRFLGLSWTEASRLFGWEWVLESALRRGGYIESPEKQT